MIWASSVSVNGMEPRAQDAGQCLGPGALLSVL